MMNNLLDFIDSMPGPMFLLLYGTVILTTFVGCMLWRSFWEPRSDADLPPIPKAPDPYAIAFLRGGENEVARLAVFHLLQQGYLEMPESVLKRKIARSPDAPEKRPESSIERLVLLHFSTPRYPNQIFGDLTSTVQRHCNEYRRQFEQDGLMTTAAMKNASLVGLMASLAIILGLGGFKLIDALNEGRSNVGFLIAMAIVSCIILVFICVHRGVTRLGRRYLEEVQREFADLRAFDEEIKMSASKTASTGFLAMGIYGASVLVGTQYSYVITALEKVASKGGGLGTGGGGCGGGGCGGGGCGGGGCGGGCGGG
jgi:uncharacterized protein (TIGR04222 family)